MARCSSGFGKIVPYTGLEIVSIILPTHLFLDVEPALVLEKLTDGFYYALLMEIDRRHKKYFAGLCLVQTPDTV